MADARHLMTVSLGKIAQARSQRGGMKLHHSLLVATVLHKARSAFMEETLRMVDSLRCQPTCTLPETPSNQPSPVPSGYTSYTSSPPYDDPIDDDDDEEEEEEDEVEGDSGVVEVTKVGIPCVDSFSRHRYGEEHQNQHFEELSIWSDEDYAPPTPAPHSVVTEKVVTIFDLDTRVNCQESALCDITNDVYHQPVSNRRKRVRDEVEEAVSSIMPKRARNDDVDADLDELFRDESTPQPTTDACVQSLTNLVSIFSFKTRCYSPAPGSTPNEEDQSSLARSVSTPDMCGSQVFHRREEHVHVSRAAIAMTV